MHLRSWGPKKPHWKGMFFFLVVVGGGKLHGRKRNIKHAVSGIFIFDIIENVCLMNVNGTNMGTKKTSL